MNRFTGRYGALAVLCLNFLALPPTARADAPEPCQCSDKKDMLYRIKEAKAVINDLKAQIQEIQVQEVRDGQPLMYSTAGYHDAINVRVQGVLDSMINAEPDPKPQTIASSETVPTICNVIIVGGTTCVRSSAQQHEDHHVQMCIKPKWHVGRRLAEVLQEEIESYSIEIDYMQIELAKLPPSCVDTWNLVYEVAVKGDGSEEKRPSGRVHRITWKVDHRYSGKAVLTNPHTMPKAAGPSFGGGNPQALAQQLMSASPQQLQQLGAQLRQQMQAVKVWDDVPTKTQPGRPIEVYIHDQVERYDWGGGEGGSFEEETVTDTWDGKGQPLVSYFSLQIDEQAQTYNVSIGVQPGVGAAKDVAHAHAIVIGRSAFGYGGKPTHEAPPPNKEQMSVASMSMPAVKGVLENGVIHHAADLPIKKDQGSLIAFSGDFEAGPDFMTGLPGVPKRINVHVFYSLSKVPDRPK